MCVATVCVPKLKVMSVVGLQGKVVGFYDSWPAKRKFPVDMAGFAVNVQYLLKFPNATMPFRAGYEEDRFLRSLGVTLDMIEPKAESCTQVTTLSKVQDNN